MSTDESTPAGNPWAFLNDYASTHPHGSTDALRFEPHVARDLAAAGSQVIMGINGLRGRIAELSGVEPVSTTASGAALAAAFGRKAVEFDAVLADHRSILSDMIETFLAAGRAYGEMDGFNAALLDGVDSDPSAALELDGYPSTTQPPGLELAPFGPSAGTLPTSLTGAGVESSTIMGESAEGMSWAALWGVGNHIRVDRVVARLSDRSGVWTWMGGEIDGIFTDFVNKVDSVTLGQWEGPGSEVAVRAVKAYADSVPRLSAAARGIGDLLFFSAGWLDVTQRAMPPTAVDASADLYALPPVGGGDLAIYRQNFRTTYLAGLAMSASHIPVLPPAAAAFGDIPHPYPGDPSQVWGGNSRDHDEDGDRPPGQRPGGDHHGDTEHGGDQHGGDQYGGDQHGGDQHGGDRPGGDGPGGRDSGEDGVVPGAHEHEATAGCTDPNCAVPGCTSAAGSQQYGGHEGDGHPPAETISAGRLGEVAPGGAIPGEVAAGLHSPLRPGVNASAAVPRDASLVAGSLVPGSAEEDRFLWDAAQQLIDAAQQGLPQLQETFEQFAGILTPDQQRDLLGRAGLEGMAGLDIPGSGDPADLETLVAGLARGAGGGGGGGGGYGDVPFLAGADSNSSKLFPRAAAFLPQGAEPQYEGAAASSSTQGAQGMPGAPGAAGAAAPGAGGGGSQYRRADYLASTDHLDDVIGDSPTAVRPVVER